MVWDEVDDMFFFLFGSYNILLIAAAIVPAVFLMVKVYRSDRLEKEPPRLILSLVGLGILATIAAMIGETIGQRLIAGIENDLVRDLLLYFVVVAGCEEGSKYFFLRRRTWFNENFNCQYDAVLYAVAVSLGFALWENLNYVFSYGFGTALVRAVTAVPGHACFGVFMGCWYGHAKRADNFGYPEKSTYYRVLSVLVPILLHGTYDFIATRSDSGSTWVFMVFVAAMFFISFRLVKNLSSNDRYIV